MERYWCLRWLLQHATESTNATVLRENLVRLEEVPLVLRVNSLPALDRGARVTLEIGRIDLLDADIHANYRATLAGHGEIDASDDDELAEDAARIGAEEVTESAPPLGADAELAGNEASASALGTTSGAE